MKKLLALLAVLLIAGMGIVYAQDQQSAPPQYPTADSQSQSTDQPDANGATDSTDQNAPGVARLSYIHGKVSTQRGDNGEWVAVTLNTPIMAGDRISTGDDSKAELQLDWADVIRLSQNSTVKIANLTNGGIQVQVGQGLVTYAVLQGAQATAEIDTPNAAVHPTTQGEYRILVNTDGESIVVVRSGGADVSTPQGSTHVDSGQMITIQGTDNPQYKIDPAPASDNWDEWNDDRDRIINRAEESGNTNRREVGTQDLDAYGQWENVPDYGQVWVPNEGSDWAPYRDGRWVWEPYYGWTWVGYEPWGWAPYHYGRWFLYNNAWAWWPGPAYVGYYPVWAPAYVSFFGWGGGWGFGVGVGFGWGWGFGHVGWLPCGPGDWYHPWWGRWGGRVNVVGFNRINGIHDGIRPLAGRGWHQYSNFDRAFTDARIRNGISSMDGRQFGRGAVPRNQERISEATLRNASMSSGKMPLSPSRESYSSTGRAADPASYRHAPSNSQRFFTSTRTNAGGNSLAARANGNVNTRNTFSGSRANNGTRAGNSFGRPSSTSNPRTNTFNNGGNNRAITSSRPGWHAFTPPASANPSRGTESRGGGNALSNSNRGSFTAPSRGNEAPANRGGGWQTFTPPASGSRGYSAPNRTFQSPASSRGTYGNSSRGEPYGRQSLNMRQPIVQPRGGSSRGYGYSAPRTYNAPRSYSAPPRSSSAPRSYGAPRGGSVGGGGSSRGSSSGGGGGSHGGGGGHPSGGGSHGHGR